MFPICVIRDMQKNKIKVAVVLIITGGLSATMAMAQRKLVVPENVKATFAQEYKNSTGVRWEKEHGTYEASFNSNNQKMSATYDDAGKKLETEVAISLSKLPEKAQKYANGKGKVKGAARIVKSDGTVIFEAELQGKDLLFAEDGKFIKESKD